MNQANRSKIQLKFIECFVDGDTSGSRCRSQSVAINCKCVRFIPIVLPSVSLNFGVCLQMILRSFYHHCHLRFYFVSCVVSGKSFINATLWETPSNTFREDKSKNCISKVWNLLQICTRVLILNAVRFLYFFPIQKHNSCTLASIATIFISGTHLN